MPTLSDQKIKHLEVIWGVVTRMNSNSFQVKGWMVTVLSASLLSTTQYRLFAIGAIFPTIVFWFLDTYYLWQERKFRALYKDVAGITKHHKIKIFEMRPDLYTGGGYSFWDVFNSITILPLYGSVIVTLLGIYFFL